MGTLNRTMPELNNFKVNVQRNRGMSGWTIIKIFGARSSRKISRQVGVVAVSRFSSKSVVLVRVAHEYKERYNRCPAISN